MSETAPRGAIVVDLDGTICEHRYPAFGAPVAGAQEALQRLKAAGFWIIIHTVRTSSVFHATAEYTPDINSPEAISAFLQRHQIPYDEIWIHDKPLAVAYIDDRALRVVGDRSTSNWRDVAETLLPWEVHPTALPGWLLWLRRKCRAWGRSGREG